MLTRDRMICAPAILGGKPVVKGTRIPVELILKFLAQGNRYEEMLEEYPDLRLEDILSVMAYARDTVSAEEIGHFDVAGV